MKGDTKGPLDRIAEEVCKKHFDRYIKKMKQSENWEKEFEKLFQESDYVEDRGSHWCVDGFVYKDRFFQLLQQTKLETVEECKVGRAKEIMEAVRVSKQQTLKEVEEKLPPRATLRGNLNFSPSSFNDCLDLCHQVINNMKDND